MLCDKCHENFATVYVSQMFNNKLSKLHLCEECTHGFSEDASLDLFFSIPELLASLFDLHVPESPAELLEERKECSNCGTSFSDIRETGKLGCSQCYEVFKESLKPLLKKVHTSLEHKGKVPQVLPDRVKMRLAIRKLQAKLTEYANREEFEQAAKVRDRIRELERKISFKR